MGGYLTHHGQLELSRAQIILEGLAKREDEIFRRRREGLSYPHHLFHSSSPKSPPFNHDKVTHINPHALLISAEERQDQNAKRRKLEQQNNKNGFSAGPSPTMALTATPSVPLPTSSGAPAHPSLPQRPAYDFAANADSIGFGAAPTPQSIQNAPTAAQALAGSNRDVVANRRAIRMANMSAAEVLKAEMSGLAPVKPALPVKPTPAPTSETIPSSATLEASPISIDPTSHITVDDDPDEVPGFGNHRNSSVVVAPPPEHKVEPMAIDTPAESDADADGEPDPDEQPITEEIAGDMTLAGVKRKFEEGPAAPDDAEDVVTVEEDDDAPPEVALALKVNADGTVEQEDTVKYVSMSFLD